MLKHLSRYNIILGSKSPRRRELLHMLRLNFSTVVIEGLKENYPDTLPIWNIPQYLSEVKADAYLERLKKNDLVITADTLVMSENKIFGKPKSSDEAVEMLMELSGKVHNVVTGVTIATHEKRTSFTSRTLVKFADITNDEAQFYVDTFNPLDKAGSYGIQEWIGAIAVEKIDGSFYNVMGLPVHQLYKELKNF